MFFSIDPTRQQTSTKTAGTGPWTLSPFAVSTGRWAAVLRFHSGDIGLITPEAVVLDPEV